MMRLAVALLLPAAMFAVENPWAKVKELKTGQELRIIRRNARQPVLATYDELTDENLVVVIKGAQTAIPRNDIDRIDARPVQKGSRIKAESKSEVRDPDARRGMPNESRAPSTNTSSGISIGSKPDFETVYRRTASAR